MIKLYCLTCGNSFAADEPRWQCACGGLIDIDFLPHIDIRKVASREQNMWRYREVLPLQHEQNIISFGEGFTPLQEIDLDGRKLLVKLDFLFPSGSYKDRGASVLVSKIKELGIQHVVEDSSGNAGAAIATYCARGNIACDIFVPASASAGKLDQIEAMGAKLHSIPGSREDTARAVLKAAESTYYASHAWNPFFMHGVKTIAYEICEQLGWRAPDIFAIPVGNGSLLLGAFIGFTELFQNGHIRKIPQMLGVQSEFCAPCAEAFFRDQNDIVSIEKKDTIAEGIAVAEPPRGKQILSAVRQSQGDFVTVSEDEIKSWLGRLYQKGFYVEPTSAAVFAGLAKYKKYIDAEKTVVTVMTGHGLKANKKIK